MKQTLLLGWPWASGAVRGCVAASRGGGALPSVVVTGAPGLVGDITGARGGARARAARAVGVGVDAETARAERDAETAARSPWAVAAVQSEHALGRAIMLRAGGRAYVAGQRIPWRTGAGMAARAARHLHERRGGIPSDTSLDEAASAAAAEMVRQVQVWEYVLGLDSLPVQRLADDACVRTHISGCGWRAAHNSLVSDVEFGGVSIGRHRAGAPRGTIDHVPLALDSGQCAVAAESLQRHLAGGRPLLETAEEEERRRVCSWLWRSIVDCIPSGGGANGARARDCARMRARMMIRVVHGNSWADAARLAGFADGGAASNVLAARQTWAALGRAAGADASTHPTARGLRTAWWRAARAEVAARRSARPWVRTTAARGARGTVSGATAEGPAAMAAGDGYEWRRTAARMGGGVMWGPWRLVAVAARGAGGRTSARLGARLARRGAGGVDVGAVAARALARREQAARVTSGARARLVAFRARAAHDWQIASRGLRKGILR